MAKLSFTLQSIAFKIANFHPKNIESFAKNIFKSKRWFVVYGTTILLSLPPHCDSLFHCRGQRSRRAIHLHEVTAAEKKELKNYASSDRCCVLRFFQHCIVLKSNYFCKIYDIAGCHTLEINEKTSWEELVSCHSQTFFHCCVVCTSSQARPSLHFAAFVRIR